MYQKILKDFKLSDSEVLNVIPYGSRIYGTNDYNSDYDFLVIIKSGTDRQEKSYNEINVAIYSVDSFQDKINQHKIVALEGFFLPKEKCLKSTKDLKFKLNKSILSEELVKRANEDWNKAKNRFDAIDDLYRAKKTLFHGFRVLDFGIQIVKNNTIKDYSSMNFLWHELNDFVFGKWEEYEGKYSEYFNLKMDEFKRISNK